MQSFACIFKFGELTFLYLSLISLLIDRLRSILQANVTCCKQFPGITSPPLLSCFSYHRAKQSRHLYILCPLSHLSCHIDHTDSHVSPYPPLRLVHYLALPLLPTCSNYDLWYSPAHVHLCVPPSIQAAHPVTLTAPLPLHSMEKWLHTTVRDEQHSVTRTVKYQHLSRVVIISVAGHLYNVDKYLDVGSSARNCKEWERQKDLYTTR